MNKRKKKQLIFIFVCFTMILAAYLGSQYYQNHLPVDDEEDEEVSEEGKKRKARSAENQASKLIKSVKTGEKIWLYR